MATAGERRPDMSTGSETQGFGATIGQLVDDTGTTYAIIAFGVPVVAAVAAIAARAGTWLNFVHVIAGAIWAGAAIYFTGVIAPTLNGLDDEVQGTVTISLIPKAVLLFSGVAIANLLTGPVLAVEFNLWDLSDPYLLTGVLIGVALLLLAIYVVGLQLIVFREVRSPGPPDQQRIASIGGRLGQAGPVVLGLQLAVLVVMALLRTGGV